MEELSGLCRVSGTHAQIWKDIHAIRRSVLFAPLEIAYDKNRPDDQDPDNHVFVYADRGKVIGTVRLDHLREQQAGALRLFAIRWDKKRQGHGRSILVHLEGFVRTHQELNIKRFYINAHPSTVGFYKKIGFIHKRWDDPTGSPLRVRIPMVREHRWP